MSLTNYSKVIVGGISIDALKQSSFLDLLFTRLKQGMQTWVITIYSEFLLAAFEQQDIKSLLAQADIRVADGIGVVIAERFLSQKLRSRNFYLKIVESWSRLMLLGFVVLFAPRRLYVKIPEKIIGSDMLFYLSEQAAAEGRSVFFLGGFGNVPERVATKMQDKIPYLRIAGYSAADPNDKSVIEQIKASKADILFVAYGPLRQERWIIQHKELLPDTSVFIGVGGAFDYFVGEKKSPNKFIRQIGLEWLFRLVTQPSRLARIWRATVIFCLSLVRIQVFGSCRLRENVVSVVKNNQGKIFIGRKSISDLKAFRMPEHKLHIPVWEFPHGGINWRESIEHAGVRELEEETGLIGSKVLARSKKTHEYEWNNAIRPLLFSRQFGLNNFFARGQRQHIVYLSYRGDPEKVVLDEREFMDYKWVMPEELPDYIKAERRTIVEIVLSDIASGVFDKDPE